MSAGKLVGLLAEVRRELSVCQTRSAEQVTKIAADWKPVTRQTVRYLTIDRTDVPTVDDQPNGP